MIKKLGTKKVGILTFQTGFRRGPCDFYPLIKWKKEFLKEGIGFFYFSNHEDKKIYEMDVLIIDHRYYRELTVIKHKFPDKNFIIEIINSLKSNGIKVILFDNGDGSGSGHWDLIEYVDVFVKKQVLKDKQLYTHNFGKYSLMPFLAGYKLSSETEKKNVSFKNEYVPCPSDQINKIKVGWNIGMLDYRYFPLSRYYPFGTGRLINNIYIEPYFETDLSKKTIDSSFRGAIKENHENYSFQRNKVVKLFNQERHTNLISDGVIPKKKYIKELRHSKVCVSPFGWGEVCYRDFEAVMAGCLLLKPGMDHLETFPNIYKKNHTYIPLKWDMSDLEEKLIDALDHYDQYQAMIFKAQEIYRDVVMDSDKFIERFKNILNH
ncbi:hypothetical protein [Rhodohalobacter sp. 8-1]|uniref:hypothetical protein n=1 Tax=Rhodohalobacter sp. 8-1 TaxID=3131972 RepID=UPI0030EF5369